MHSTTGRDFPLVACMMCVLNVYVPVTAIVHRLLIGDATAFVHIPPEAYGYEVRLLCSWSWVPPLRCTVWRPWFNRAMRLVYVSPVVLVTPKCRNVLSSICCTPVVLPEQSVALA